MIGQHYQSSFSGFIFMESLNPHLYSLILQMSFSSALEYVVDGLRTGTIIALPCGQGAGLREELMYLVLEENVILEAKTLYNTRTYY